MHNKMMISTAPGWKIWLCLALLVAGSTACRTNSPTSTTTPTPASNAITLGDPLLIAASVTFVMPDCDDKNHDTTVDVTIVKDGVLIAEGQNLADNQEFDDPGKYGPFPLAIRQAVTKSAYQGSATKLRIAPFKGDTWCTRIMVDAVFADNTRVQTSSCNELKVSEKNPNGQFVNLPCQ